MGFLTKILQEMKDSAVFIADKILGHKPRKALDLKAILVLLFTSITIICLSPVITLAVLILVVLGIVRTTIGICKEGATDESSNEGAVDSTRNQQ